MDVRVGLVGLGLTQIVKRQAQQVGGAEDAQPGVLDDDIGEDQHAPPPQIGPKQADAQGGRALVAEQALGGRAERAQRRRPADRAVVGQVGDQGAQHGGIVN